MTVSVIIPVYNASRYLEKCVESIKAQTYDNWELILVDDGSTDYSGAICDAMAADDARINVLHTANSGASAARNRGIEASSGSWVTFVDADDYVTPDYLKDMFDAAIAEDADMAVTGWVKGEETKIFSPAVVDDDDFLYFYRGRVNFGYVLGKLYRRSLFAEGGLRFDPGVKWAEDSIFFNRALLVSRRVVVVGKTNYIYNYHDASSVHRLHDYADELHGAQVSREVTLSMHERYGKEILKYYNPYAHVWRTVKAVYKDDADRKSRIAKLSGIRFEKWLLHNRPQGIVECITTYLTIHRHWRLLDMILSRGR